MNPLSSASPKNRSRVGRLAALAAIFAIGVMVLFSDTNAVKACDPGVGANVVAAPLVQQAFAAPAFGYQQGGYQQQVFAQTFATPFLAAAPVFATPVVPTAVVTAAPVVFAAQPVFVNQQHSFSSRSRFGGGFLRRGRGSSTTVIRQRFR